MEAAAHLCGETPCLQGHGTRWLPTWTDSFTRSLLTNLLRSSLSPSYSEELRTRRRVPTVPLGVAEWGPPQAFGFQSSPILY